MSEERDRLLDALLAETLGGETPPDLTARICERAFSRSAWANPWVLGAGVVAAAALVAIVVSLSLQEQTQPPTEIVKPAPKPETPPTPPPYPEPAVSGSFEVAGGGAPARGATIQAKDQGAAIALGGYCQVHMDPQSRVRIDGREKEEEVLLQDGRVTCVVERSHGSFAVKTPLGTVSVTGTKFQVEMRKGDEHMEKQSMYIKVLAGTVLVASAWGQSVLAAGQEQEQGNQGTLTGVVTAKTEKSISVRVDHTDQVKQFIPNWIGGLPKDGGGPDKVMLRTIRETPLKSHVRVQWKLDEHLRVVGLEILERPAGEVRDGDRKREGGDRVGGEKPESVVREGDRKRESSDRAGGEKPESVVREGDRKRESSDRAGGEKPESVVREGDRKRESSDRAGKTEGGNREGDRKRESSDRAGGEKSEGAVREGDRKREGGDQVGPGEGVLTGTVTAKGESWIEVRGDEQDAPAKYTPRWIGGMPRDGGGLDKQMLAVFRTLKVGERIRLTWMEDERLRALKIERMGGER